nr:Dihydrofolate reductase [uncultured bacterium]
MNNKVSLIAALTHEYVIGKDNDLPWPRLEGDLQNFKQLTTGHTVLMGKNTYASILARLKKPLPNRRNVVISKTLPEQQGIIVYSNLDEALEKELGEIFVIGGQQIYEQTIDRADKMYLSWVKRNYEGDAYFPRFNSDEWDITIKEFPDFEFVTYERKK